VLGQRPLARTGWPAQTSGAQSGIRAARRTARSERMTMAATRTISFTLNGEPVSAAIATHHTLLEVVRDTSAFMAPGKAAARGYAAAAPSL
jgi:hypothetical protein